jgi:hypothetical protein
MFETRKREKPERQHHTDADAGRGEQQRLTVDENLTRVKRSPVVDGIPEPDTNTQQMVLSDLPGELLIVDG